MRYLRLPVRESRTRAKLLRTMANDVPVGHTPVIESKELIRQLAAVSTTKERNQTCQPYGNTSSVPVERPRPSVVKWRSTVSTQAVSRAHQHSGNENVFWWSALHLSSPSAFNSTGLHAAGSNVYLKAISRGRSGSLPISNIVRQRTTSSSHHSTSHSVEIS